MKQLKQQDAEASGRHKNNRSNRGNSTIRVCRSEVDSSRSDETKHTTSALRRHHEQASVQGLSSTPTPGEEEKQADRRISTGTNLAQMSRAGVVDAILEVGRRRNSLFGELRSALVSGNDSTAIGVARQLCGLAA